jgi:hypothetical protein
MGRSPGARSARGRSSGHRSQWRWRRRLSPPYPGRGTAVRIGTGGYAAPPAWWPEGLEAGDQRRTAPGRRARRSARACAPARGGGPRPATGAPHPGHTTVAGTAFRGVGSAGSELAPLQRGPDPGSLFRWLSKAVYGAPGLPWILRSCARKAARDRGGPGAPPTPPDRGRRPARRPARAYRLERRRRLAGGQGRGGPPAGKRVPGHHRPLPRARHRPRPDPRPTRSDRAAGRRRGARRPSIAPGDGAARGASRASRRSRGSSDLPAPHAGVQS